ncbi:hypothetical protein GCM10023204_12970 [Actinomycetospora succinea]
MYWSPLNASGRLIADRPAATDPGDLRDVDHPIGAGHRSVECGTTARPWPGVRDRTQAGDSSVRMVRFPKSFRQSEDVPGEREVLGSSLRPPRIDDET